MSYLKLLTFFGLFCYNNTFGQALGWQCLPNKVIDSISCIEKYKDELWFVHGTPSQNSCKISVLKNINTIIDYGTFPTSVRNVMVILHYKDTLIIGGAFRHLKGDTFKTKIVKFYDNTIEALDKHYMYGNIYGREYVAALQEFKGNLVVGGYFEGIGHATSSSVALWTGTAWESMGLGLFSQDNWTKEITPGRISHIGCDYDSNAVSFTII
ncbi:MAG: hypothetical protein NTW54_07195 [Bacteroidetes bacterium]|nr:hypothetical protein [Bacteroidota bacterium]